MAFLKRVSGVSLRCQPLLAARAVVQPRSFATKRQATFEHKVERFWVKSWLMADRDGHVAFPHSAMTRTFEQFLADTEPKNLDLAKSLPDGWWLEPKHQQHVPDGWHLDDRYWDWREQQIEDRCKASNLSEEFRQKLLRELVEFRETTETIPPPTDAFVDLKIDEEGKNLIQELHGYIPTTLKANRFTETFIVTTPDNQQMVWRSDLNPENEEELNVLELDGVEIVYPPLHQTLDWVLPTPVPLHSFPELPLIKEMPYSTKVAP